MPSSPSHPHRGPRSVPGGDLVYVADNERDREALHYELGSTVQVRVRENAAVGTVAPRPTGIQMPEGPDA